MWNKLRFIFLNRPKHKKHKRTKSDVPYIGPEQWMLLVNNQRYRDRGIR